MVPVGLVLLTEGELAMIGESTWVRFGSIRNTQGVALSTRDLSK